MAIGKVRGNKRSSSSGTSYASTVTTLVFVAFCVLGVWMLTSNSFISSPQTTTRTSTSTHSTTTHNTKPITQLKEQGTNPVFEDNPGDLPDDAIKPDETTLPDHNTVQKSDDDDHKNYASADSNTDDGENSSGMEKVDAESDNNKDKQDLETEKGAAEIEINVERENVAVEDNNEVVTKQEDGNNKIGESVKQGSVVEENPLGLKGKISKEEQQKQKEHEVQISEESSMTKQQVEEEIETNHQSESTQKKSSETSQTRDDQETHNGKPDVESKGKEENRVDNHENSQDTQLHQISDEEQEHRMEQQQQQEEQQSQRDKQEATSNDQIQHDETPIQSHETEETKSQAGNQQEPIHDETQNGVSNLNKEMKQTKEASFPNGESSSGIPKESRESKKAWSTQADQSENQKERRKDGPSSDNQNQGSIYGYEWQLCNVTAGTDYIPCLDNEKALKTLRSWKHYEHRERHCPEEPPTCLVPLPGGYKKSVEWPQSRNKIWYHNVPHTKLAEVKGHQNWVKVTGEFLTFPGGGTQFIHGALHYIDFIQEAVPDIAWGKRTRVILDVGCGVASFGGYLFDRDVLAMSFAPKDEHEAQVQFALERGIPAISAVMGSQRLPFPSRVFDLLHCARCRVPWHAEGGALLLELNRVLRPGGFFVWSATPVYQKLEEDVQIWNEMSALTVSMCWELVTIKKDKLNQIGAAIYQKPDSNECYDGRKQNIPPMCKTDDDPNAAWYVPLQSCLHRVPVNEAERGSRWPEEWPRRLQTPPYWLNKSQMGIYGKPAPDDFVADYEHWKRVVSKSYLSGLGISWSNVRNIMDMRAVYGGFGAAMKDLNVWVLNVVNIDSPDTLPIIYERGLFGIYHDWCESFSTYPRTYDLLHADHLFSRLKKRCKIAPVMAEIDRIVRPGGKLIVRDESKTVGEVENLLKSLRWEVHLTFSKNQEGILSAQKSDWRPDSYVAPS